MKSKLLKGYIDDFGELLGKAWETKKMFSPKITNDYLNEIYTFALSNGAIGGKLLGAGSKALKRSSCESTTLSCHDIL